MPARQPMVLQMPKHEARKERLRHECASHRPACHERLGVGDVREEQPLCA